MADAEALSTLKLKTNLSRLLGTDRLHDSVAVPYVTEQSVLRSNLA